MTRRKTHAQYKSSKRLQLFTSHPNCHSHNFVKVYFHFTLFLKDKENLGRLRVCWKVLLKPVFKIYEYQPQTIQFSRSWSLNLWNLLMTVWTFQKSFIFWETSPFIVFPVEDVTFGLKRSQTTWKSFIMSELSPPSMWLLWHCYIISDDWDKN